MNIEQACLIWLSILMTLFVGAELWERWQAWKYDRRQREYSEAFDLSLLQQDKGPKGQGQSDSDIIKKAAVDRIIKLNETIGIFSFLSPRQPNQKPTATEASILGKGEQR